MLTLAVATVELELSPQDEEGIRWYLEDYLQWAVDARASPVSRL